MYSCNYDLFIVVNACRCPLGLQQSRNDFKNIDIIVEIRIELRLNLVMSRLERDSASER